MNIQVRVEPHTVNVQARVAEGEWLTVGTLYDLLLPAYREDLAVLESMRRLCEGTYNAMLLTELRSRCTPEYYEEIRQELGVGKEEG